MKKIKTIIINNTLVDIHPDGDVYVCKKGKMCIVGSIFKTGDVIVAPAYSPSADEFCRAVREKPYSSLVKSIRKFYELSQQELAKKAKTTQKIISLIENNKYNPSIKLMERINSVAK